MARQSWSELIREHRTLLIIIVIGFFLIEVEIFALAAMKSGRQSWIQVLNQSGDVIYEVKGTTMTNFNRYYFESAFGPFEDYRTRLETREVPFPFRAWFTAAVGLPVGMVLLLAFILKAVMAFIQGRPDGVAPDTDKDDGQASGTQLERLMVRISRLNIFIIGFFIAAGVFLYWVLPNMLTFLAKTSLETLIEFKWFFIALFTALFGLFAWFMYMKYQLARQSLDAQTEIRKYELQLEYVRQGGNPDALLIDNSAGRKLLGTVPGIDHQNPDKEIP